MTKTTLTSRFLGMTMLAGLLMAPFAIAQNEDQPELLIQGVQQRQLVEGSDQVAEARTLFAAPAQPAGPSNGSTIVDALIPVAEGPLGVFKTLRLAEPQIVSGFTDLGIPSWLYCKLHPRWCKNF
jgi:hypothetical protein